MDRPRRSDCTAGQMDGEAGWWTTSGNIGLPPLARAMGVGRQQQHNRKDLETIICNFYGEEDVSEAKTLIHQYYEIVIGPRPGRQNRGTKTLK